MALCYRHDPFVLPFLPACAAGHQCLVVRLLAEVDYRELCICFSHYSHYFNGVLMIIEREGHGAGLGNFCIFMDSSVF